MRRDEILQDKLHTCKICGDSFVFTAGEQGFFRDRCLAEPRRCPKCRVRRQALIKEVRGEGE